ncbi:MAG: bifunctional UDP-N-acetylglucosamine diphosphorylase/glucosamine-1-phosphate N-acetyltransferase GlmU [Rhodospirillales bacterium]
MADKLAALILAAGAGKRMRSARPKVLHELAGRTMIGHVLAHVAPIAGKVVVVVGPNQQEVAKAVAPHMAAIQDQPLGTAHAARAGVPALGHWPGEVLILFGDTPLVSTATLRRLVAKRRKTGAALAVLGFRPVDPSPYGRLITGKDGALEAIVESKDASVEQRRIDLSNSGAMVVDGKLLPELLRKVGNRNSKKEYYLTELVALARKAGQRCDYVEGPPEEFLGINNRAELAAAEAALQRQLRERAMANGATLTDPSSVWFSWDTKLGRDVVVGPNVFFGPGVTVSDDVAIRGFCHIVGAKIGQGSSVGPFARLRPGAVLGRNVHIGNFVEIKATTVADNAKINHLAYIGDASVGRASNIGAGAITVNYDGFGKYRTEIGDDVFIGSNASLVAPVKIGRGATVGAGSVVVSDVPANSLTIARPRQRDMAGAAPKLRARNKAKAEAAKAKRK